jgi:hypothetical protein
MVVSVIAFTIIGNTMPRFLELGSLKSSTLMLVSGHFVKIIYAYIFARLCLLLPSIAVDNILNLQRSIELSRGNGWRLAIVVSVIPVAMKIITNIVYREDASAWEYMLWLTITSALLTVEIAALSISYRELVEHAATDKP